MISGVVLGAGAGVRMGAPKAALVVDGVRLVDRAVGVLRDGGCDEVIAVVPPGVSVGSALTVENPHAQQGMSTSLALGLQQAGGSRAVLLLVDLPGVTSDAVRRVIDTEAPVAIATYNGRRGHPVAIERALWPDVIEAAVGDQGARPFLAAHPELVVEVPCEGDPTDLDTPEDLDAWLTRQS